MSVFPRCTGCFQFSYCDSRCQKADRPSHKEFCDKIKNAADRSPVTLAMPEELDAASLLASANAGCAVSQGCLGACYANGSGGVAVDLETAFGWYSRAATSRDAPDWVLHDHACCHLWGIGTPIDPTRAVRMLRPLADRGFAQSQYVLADCYKHGEGVPYDPVEAFTLLERAAVAGHPESLNLAAFALETALGVPEDKVRAFQYYHAAAEAGVSAAMYNVANCYRFGRGTKRDILTAVEWLERARDKGHVSATRALADIAAGEPTPPGGSADEGKAPVGGTDRVG